MLLTKSLRGSRLLVSSSRRLILIPPSKFHRGFSSSKFSPSQAVIELREYDIFPEHASTYMQLTADTSELRKSLSPSLRFFSLPETGGKLHVATHAYYYAGGLSERDETRREMAENKEWQDYIASMRFCVQAQSSTIFVEAPLVRQFGLPGLGVSHTTTATTTATTTPGGTQPAGDKNCILEIRRYNLKLGYDTVPKFLQLYGSGLPSKLNAEGTDPTTSLVTLLYSEVGRLNEVIEIWRHGNGTAAMEQSRAAARGAQEWRSAIANIADLAIEFRSTIHKPVAFSPIQ
jgi:hypothetical protein